MSKLSRRTVLVGLSAFAAMPIRAETQWPARPITLMHGFPPGGPVDVLSRILAEGLSARLGQPVVVEAKPGATGTTAGGTVARAAPDGYTLMAVPATFVATAAMYQALPYRPIEDFSFISTTAEYPFVLVSCSDGPLQSVADLVHAARSQVSPLQYGTAGVGSLQHLTMELFAKRANIQLQHIPYRGGAPAIIDLLGKRLDLVLDPPTALGEFIKDGRLRALAVTGGSRFFGLPDVPTIIESGFQNFVVVGYQGIAAPAGLPTARAQQLNQIIAAVLADAKTIEQMKKVGNIPSPSSPEQYKARLAADIAQWKSVVEAAKIARI
jgi:tripartite-type tricarboxylate transporter receptor subunit TctC